MENKKTVNPSFELSDEAQDQVAGDFGGPNSPCPDCGHLYFVKPRVFKSFGNKKQRFCPKKGADSRGCLRPFRCAGHGAVLAGESPATGSYRQV